MSKLDELIRELCPDGVEYKRFDEVCTLNARIGWQRLTKAEYMSKGDYLLITGTDFTETHEIDYSTCVYVTEERYKQDPKIQLKNGDILITKDGTLGKVAQVKGLEMPATLNGGVFVVRCKDGSLENRFILHYLLSNHFQSVVEQQKTGSTISHLTQTLFSRLMIPIPPLEIQREIVRILDNFTVLTAELTAELTARKTQYGFYREKLLNKTKISATMTKVADLGKWSGGKTPSMAEKKYWESGTIPWVSSKDVKQPILSDTIDHITNAAIDEASMTVYPAGSVAIVTRSGILRHTFPVTYIPFETTVNQDIKILVTKEGISSRYVSHALQAYGESIRRTTKKQGGTVDSLDFQKVLAYKIPVPPIDVQNRIVNVLDNFEKICSDLNIGLPAEIEARQKQYEYYRDKLLTFAETGNTILSRAEQSRAEQSRAEQSRAEH